MLESVVSGGSLNGQCPFDAGIRYLDGQPVPRTDQCMGYSEFMKGYLEIDRWTKLGKYVLINDCWQEDW